MNNKIAFAIYDVDNDNKISASDI